MQVHRKFFTLSVIFLAFYNSCYSQQSMDANSKIVLDSNAIRSTNLSVPADDEENDLKLLFDTIPPDDFKKYKKLYNSKISLDSSKITLTDSLLLLKTEIKTLAFQAKKDYSQYAYYKGFLKSLNLLLIQDIDGENATGSLLLVDNKTGKIFSIDCPFDYPLETPMISPKNDYLFFYSNNLQEDNQSFISILKIRSIGDSYNLKVIADIEIDQWIIKDIIWMNETTFAIKTISHHGAENIKEKVIYLKASLKMLDQIQQKK